MAYKCKSGPAKMTDPARDTKYQMHADRSSGERLVSQSSSITPKGNSPFSGYSKTITRTYATSGTKGSYTPPKFTPAGDAAYKKMSLSERKRADDKYIAANTKKGTPGTSRTVSQTLNFSGIQPVGGAKITSSMAGLQPLVKKPPTRTSKTPPPPRKPKKPFGKTDVGKFFIKLGNTRLPKIRLPKIGARGKSQCKRGCGWKNRMRGN